MKRIFIILTSLFLLNNLTSISSYSPLANNSTTTDLGIFKDYSSDEVKTYYENLKEGISGEELLSSLEVILKNGQKTVSESDAKRGDWSFFLLLDRDYDKDPLTENEIKTQSWKNDNVICSPLYDETFTFIYDNKPGGTYVDREHVLPKSYGFANRNKDHPYFPLAATDMHNLHMGESENNQNGHNNYPYGNVVNKSTAKSITSAISGNITGWLGTNKNGIKVYEPLDKDKGDIVRSIFYMAARYHTYDATLSNSPALKLSNNPAYISGSVYADETKDNPCEYGILSDLLDWNELDPVDDHEIHRNNLVYTIVQNNRNPFIDYPNWARIAFETFDTGISKDNPSRVSGTTEPDNPDEPVTPDNPDEPDDSNNPDTDDKTETPWYKDIANAKYYPYYAVAALVLLSFIISGVCITNKKKKKGTTKKKKTKSSKNSALNNPGVINNGNNIKKTLNNKESSNDKK